MHYLITFRCYGTWLHGDNRGSIDRRRNGTDETFLREPHQGLERSMREQMKDAPRTLNTAMRKVVETTLREVAAHRGWELSVLTVRTNHVHAVVSANDKPEKVMNDFKSWSTRRLREAGLTSPQSPVWSRHGSTRYLWNDQDLYEACNYAAESQGKDFSDET